MGPDTSTQHVQGSSRGKKAPESKAPVHPTHQENPKTSGQSAQRRQGSLERALCQGPMVTPSDASQASHTGTDEVDRTMDTSHFSEPPLPSEEQTKCPQRPSRTTELSSGVAEIQPESQSRRPHRRSHHRKTCSGLGTPGVLPAAARRRGVAASPPRGPVGPKHHL